MSVRHSPKRVPRGNRSGSPAPEPIAHKTAAYTFTITVLGYTVPIFILSTFPDEEQVGEYNHDPHEIYVKGGLVSPVEEADVLLHEVVHAINRIALAAENRFSEVQINALSTILLDTLARNPKLRTYLYERLGETV